MDEMYILETTSPARPSTSGQQVLGSLTPLLSGQTAVLSYVSVPMACDNRRCPCASFVSLKGRGSALVTLPGDP